MPRTRTTTPLLTADEERQLAQAIEAGREARQRLEIVDSAAEPATDDQAADRALVDAGEAARLRFMEANLRLVYSIAGKSRVPAHVDRDDVVQDGMLGLERAVDKFDWRKGYKFSTYATWWIRQGIQRGLENTASTVRIPAHRSSELRMAQIGQSLMGGNDDTLADLPPSLQRLHELTLIDSIDRRIGDGADSLAARLAADDLPTDEAAAQAIDGATVRRLVAELEPTARHAVVRRFGLDGGDPSTYTSLGRELDLAPEAARRLVLRSLDRLRPHLDDQESTRTTAAA